MIAILLVAALYGAAKFSLEALAWVLCGVFLVRFLAMTYALTKHIGVSFADVLGALRSDACVAGCYHCGKHRSGVSARPVSGGSDSAFWLCYERYCDGLRDSLLPIPQLCFDRHLGGLAARPLAGQPIVREFPLMHRLMTHLARADS